MLALLYLLPRASLAERVIHAESCCLEQVTMSRSFDDRCSKLWLAWLARHAHRKEQRAVRVWDSHTQKSISRFPAEPNSRSPTWKVTDILSSLCRDSWKHSRPWAGRTMLCAAAVWKATAAARNVLAAVRKCMIAVGLWYGVVGDQWLGCVEEAWMLSTRGDVVNGWDPRLRELTPFALALFPGSPL